MLRCDEALRDSWSDWPQMRAFADREVMARQSLNAELALQLARADGMEWLVHLDADELLDVGVDSLGAQIGHAGRSGALQLTFENLEAVPATPSIKPSF